MKVRSGRDSPGPLVPLGSTRGGPTRRRFKVSVVLSIRELIASRRVDLGHSSLKGPFVFPIGLSERRLSGEDSLASNKAGAFLP